MARALAFGLLLLACGPTEPQVLSRLAVVSGRLSTPVVGDGWLFLYAPHQGPPGRPAIPIYATAVSRGRLATDAHFVFPSVNPNPYRLSGFVDVNGNADPFVDVLTQPGAGDRVGPGLELNVQPGRQQTFDDYTADSLVTTEPPAFHLEGLPSDVRLETTLGSLTTLRLVSDDVGHLEPHHTSFTLGLVDDNHDQVPDDADGDGVPDLSLTLFFLWKPGPGQAPPGTTVVVPLAFDPTPFLTALNGSLTARVSATDLLVTLVPTAQELVTDAQGHSALRLWNGVPTGAYELVALGPGGQFWRLPNQLGAVNQTQAVTFHFDRAGP